MREAVELIRLVYTSRSTAGEGRAAADAQAILAVANRANPALGITGLLAVTGGHYLQMLEGSAATVDALFEAIRHDPRHTDVAVLHRSAAPVRLCPEWAMGMAVRSEPASATGQRVELLKQHLAHDPNVSASDFFRLLFSPGIDTRSGAAARAQGGGVGGVSGVSGVGSVSGVVLANPSGLWGAAVVQRIASDSALRLGRTTLFNPQDPASRSLVEYVDLPVSGVGPVRAMALSNDSVGRALIAPLTDRTALLVLLLSPSDLAAFPQNVAHWLDPSNPRLARAPILLVCNAAPERVEAVAADIRRRTTVPVVAARLKMSDSLGIWNTVQRQLREREAERDVERDVERDAERETALDIALPIGEAPLPAVPAGAAPVPETEPVQLPTPAPAPAPSPAPLPIPALPQPDALKLALRTSGCIEQLMAIAGTQWAAVLDTHPPGVLLSAHSAAGAADAAAHRDELMRIAQGLQAKQRLIHRLGLNEAPEDISLTSSAQVQVFRPLRGHPSVYLCVTLVRDGTELGAARLHLRDIETSLALVV